MSDFDDEIRGKLEPGERLLWTGRPPTELRIDWREIAGVVFTLAVLATLFAFWNEIFGDAPRIFALYGILVAIGLVYNISGRFLLTWLYRRSTNYAVTDRMLIVFTDLVLPKTTKIDLETLSDLTLTELPSGGGTIRFGQRPDPVQVRLRSWFTAEPQVDLLQFELDQSAHEVYKLIRNATRKARDGRDDSIDDDDVPRDVLDERIQREHFPR
jgi:hypothetical protein